MYTLEDLGLENDENHAGNTDSIQKVLMLLEIMNVEMAMQEDVSRAAMTLHTHVDKMTEDQARLATHDFSRYEDELTTLAKHMAVTAAKSVALEDPKMLLDEIIGTITVAYVLGYTDGTRYAQ